MEVGPFLEILDEDADEEAAKWGTRTLFAMECCVFDHVCSVPLSLYFLSLNAWSKIGLKRFKGKKSE